MPRRTLILFVSVLLLRSSALIIPTSNPCAKLHQTMRRESELLSTKTEIARLVRNAKNRLDSFKVCPSPSSIFETFRNTFHAANWITKLICGDTDPCLPFARADTNEIQSDSLAGYNELVDQEVRISFADEVAEQCHWIAPQRILFALEDNGVPADLDFCTILNRTTLKLGSVHVDCEDFERFQNMLLSFVLST